MADSDRIEQVSTGVVDLLEFRRTPASVSSYGPPAFYGPPVLSGPSQFRPSHRPDLPPLQIGLSVDKMHRTASISGSLHEDDTAELPATPPPKTPYTAMPILSEARQEEEDLEKAQALTDKEQVKDMKHKTRVRMAKYLLRFTNFSCSLIVLSMLSTSLNIFRMTKDLPPRYIGTKPMPPWAPKQKLWPQLTVLTISCISLLIATLALWRYRFGPTRRARRSDTQYNLFAIGTWLFSIMMWLLGASVLQHARNTSGNQDFWGWSCLQNTRSKVFSDQIKYSLICRLQNWSLVCCIIEVVIEAITIGIYGMIAYRFWSKRRLTKAVEKRNLARGELYAKQWQNEQGMELTQQVAGEPRREEFKLQPVPQRAEAQPETHQALRAVEAAPGEKVYDAVAVPHAYEG